MRRSAFLAAAAVMLGATVLSAQAPNLSGTWTRDTTGMGAMMAGGGGGGGGGGRGMGGGAGPMTIAQAGGKLTITRSMGGNDVVTTYNLDGTDSKNTGPSRGGNPGVETTSNATWTGVSLTIVTKSPAQDGSTRVTTAVYSLDSAGKVLSIATTQPARGGGDPVTNTVKYNKGM